MEIDSYGYGHGTFFLECVWLTKVLRGVEKSKEMWKAAWNGIEVKEENRDKMVEIMQTLNGSFLKENVLISRKEANI